MSDAANVLNKPLVHPDYSLTGASSALAVEQGLAEADWYQCPVPRETMRGCSSAATDPPSATPSSGLRCCSPSGYATWRLWGTWWAILPYVVYSAIYASTSDSRWHESGHGTAFKTDWMNNALYEVASFMVMRESSIWRWSHSRHHSDTIIVGRDPEIAVPRPPELEQIFSPSSACALTRPISMRCSCTAPGACPPMKTPSSRSRSLRASIFTRASISLLTSLSSGCLSAHAASYLSCSCASTLFGSWLMPVYGMTQHAGLAENVLDHRLNCRTVNMNSSTGTSTGT